MVSPHNPAQSLMTLIRLTKANHRPFGYICRGDPPKPPKPPPPVLHSGLVTSLTVLIVICPYRGSRSTLLHFQGAL